MIRRLLAAAGYRQSSATMSRLASEILREPMGDLGDFQDSPQSACDDYNAMLRKAKRLAGSVLSQDEEKG